MKNFIILLFLTSLFTACKFSKSNVQTFVSGNCGVSWKKIAPGKHIPTGVGNPCFAKVTIPAIPMGGEVAFRVKFDNDVVTMIEASYTYEIVDGIKYLPNARYLGKKNTSSENETNSVDNYEIAENTVIERRLKDVAKDIALSINVVDYNPNQFDQPILTEVNKRLAEVGITIQSLDIVPRLSEQTSEAIDVVTAKRVYESAGESELGDRVITAKAGATKVVVDQKVEQQDEH